MKLLLTSAGITNHTLTASLLELVGKPFSEANLAFIPTAANVEVGDKGWLIDDLNNFRNLGLASIDIVDISALPQEAWLPRIKQAYIIVLSGAGSMIVSPSIFLTSDEPIFHESRSGLTDDTGLGLVDFYVRPHFNSPYFPQSKVEVIAQSAQTVTQPIYALDDDSAVVVSDGQLSVASEGKWQKFN